eukprot:CFRG3291T1
MRKRPDLSLMSSPEQVRNWSSDVEKDVESGAEQNGRWLNRKYNHRTYRSRGNHAILKEGKAKMVNLKTGTNPKKWFKRKGDYGTVSEYSSNSPHHVEAGALRHARTVGVKEDVSGNKTLEGVYFMSVALIQGKDLFESERGHGTRNCYVKVVSNGQEHTSSTISKDPNPVWNQRFDFAFKTQPEEFMIMLYDSRQNRKHTLLGSYCYRLETSNWELGQCKYQWVPLQGSVSNGEIQLQIVCRSSTMSPECESKLLYVQTLGLCTIRLVRAKDIKPTITQWKKWATLGLIKSGNIVRPRVIIEFGLTAYRTKSHSGKNPSFNKECRFWVREGEENYFCRISVYNTIRNKSALVGRAYISMRDICERGGEYDFVVDVREEYDVMRDRDHTAMLKQSYDDLVSLNNASLNVGPSEYPLKSVCSQNDLDKLDSGSASDIESSNETFNFDKLNFHSTEELLMEDEKTASKNSNGLSHEYFNMTESGEMLDCLSSTGGLSSTEELSDDSGDTSTFDSGTIQHSSNRGRLNLNLTKVVKIRKSKPLTVVAMPFGRESIHSDTDHMSFSTPDPDFTDEFMNNALQTQLQGKKTNVNKGALVGSLALRVKFVPKDEVEHWFFRRMLDEFDEDGDGKLSHKETQNVVEAIGSISDLTQTQLEDLTMKLCGEEKDSIQEEDLIQYLQSPEFHTHPMSYSLLAYLSHRPDDLVTLIDDIYETAGTSDKTNTVGAAVLTIRDGERTEKDMMGMKVLDRKTGLVVEEHIPKYIRIALKVIYNARKGKNATNHKRVQRILKRMSVKEGRRMNDSASVTQIRPFIKVHKLDPRDWLLPVDDENENYPCFNAFFYRKLTPGARVIDSKSDDRVAVCPADCRMVVYESVVEAAQVWVKGSLFTVERLLSDELSDIAPSFFGGSMCIARLAPQDYHRWHFPVSGNLGRKVLIEGGLFTVNPIAIRQKVNVFTENVRVCHEIHTKEFGLVVAVCIGATLVGSVNITSIDHSEVIKGDEHGFFAFGGSTVILLFQPGRIKFDRDIVENSKKPLETLVKMGMRLGVAIEPAIS